MARQDKISKLERLEEQQRQLAAQIRDEKAKEKAKERKRATRRKIMKGGEAELDPEIDRILLQRLEKKLTRPEDRALFGFPDAPHYEERSDFSGQVLETNHDRYGHIQTPTE